MDDFFEHGRLRLSSFAKFLQHEDEQRNDSKEGHALLIHRTAEGGGQTLAVRIEPNHNAYVLCGSSVPSHSLKEAFGADSAIIIRDVVGFVEAVAEAIPGFVRSIHGICSYQSTRIILRDLGWNDIADAETSDPEKMNQAGLDVALGELLTADVNFLKGAEFAHQVEYRMLWAVEKTNEHIDIEAPNAIRFCESWDDQAELVAVDRETPVDTGDADIK